MKNARTESAPVGAITHSRLSQVLRRPGAPEKENRLVDEALDIITSTLATIDRLQAHLEQMLAIAEKAEHLSDPMKRAELSDAFAESCAALDNDIEKDKRNNFSLIDSGLGILAFDLGTHKPVHISVPHINLMSDWKGLCVMPHISTIRRSGSVDEVINGLSEAIRKLNHARTTYQGSIAWLERHR